MKSKTLAHLLTLAFLCSLIQVAEAGKLRRLLYYYYSGMYVTNLFGPNTLGVQSFPNSPDAVDFLPNGTPFSVMPPFTAESAVNITENYGGLIQGYLTAPESGDYTFWLSTDDEGQFWMTTDPTDPMNPAKTNLICWVPGWSATREWNKFPQQQSTPVNLQAGKTYYVHIIQKEGTGGDHVVLGWQTPSGALERPMPSWHFQAIKNTNPLLPAEPDVEVVVGPVSPTTAGAGSVSDGNLAVIYANVNLDPPVTYQWLRDNVAVTGATNAYYIFRANSSDMNSQWTVQARSGGSTYLGGPGTLVVSSDKPTVLSANVLPQNPTMIRVVFSEDVNPSTATNLSSYSLSPAGTAILAATLGADNRTVTLSTALLTPTRLYTLNISGVQDLATPPNTMDPASTTFVIADGSINFRVFSPTFATDLTTLSNATRTGSTISTVYNNDQFILDQPITYTSIGWNITPLRDNYIGQMIGYVTAPETGQYKFAIASDDHSILYLGTSDLRSSKRPICYYNGSTGRWNLGQQLANQQSALITLQGGQRYYLEAVYRDGTGGDGVTVCWQTPNDTLTGRTMPTANASVQTDTEPFLIPARYLSPYTAFGNLFFRTNLPSTLSATAGTRPLLSVTVDGSLPYSYQWYRNGTAIPGATNASYLVPFLQDSDNGANFSVTVTNLFSSTNSVVTALVVAADTVKPGVASVGSLYKQSIELRFTEPVTASSAANTGNYLLFNSANAPVTVTGAVLDGSDASHVTLQTAAMPDTDLMKLVVQNVADLSPAANVITPATNLFRANNFDAAASIKNTQVWNINAVGEQLFLTAGGDDIWNNADGCLFLYKSVTGNFDYKVQGVSLPAVNSWCKMGLMARSSTAAGSRNVFNPFTPVTPGQNTYSAQVRDTTDGASTSSNDAGSPLNVNVQPGVPARPTILPYPSWTRIQRIGNTVHYYYGTNGTNWTYWTFYDSTLSPEGALPATMMVGLALTSHDTARTVDGVLSSFTAVNDGPLYFTLQPTNITWVEGSTNTLYCAVSGSTPYYYQWFTNGVAMTDSSVTNASLTITRVPYTWNGLQFSVRVTNPYNQTITSTNALLTVIQDTIAPTVRYFGTPKINLDPTKVKLIYSEPIDRISAETVANYQITTVPGGARLNVQSVSLDLDERTVSLTTDPQTAGTTYKVVVNNVKDLACCPVNTIAPNSTEFFYYAGTTGNFAQRSDGYAIMEAENAQSNESGTSGGSRTFSSLATAPGYSGTGYMVVPNGAGTGGTGGTSPQLYGTGAKLTFNVVFNRTGRNIVWVRGWNENTSTAGNDDSIYVGFNDTAGSDPANDWMVGMTSDVNQSQLSSWSGSTWSWRSDRSTGSDPLTFTNTSTGLHRFIIWQREDGTLIDKIVLEPGNRAASSTGAPAQATANGGLGEPESWEWNVAPPAAPTVTLVNPVNGQLFAAASDIPIEASVTAPTPIALVEFFSGATLIGTNSTAPYTMTWKSVPEGIYSLTVRVTDVLGYQVTSSAAQVVVDSTKPVAYAVGSLGGTSIGVYFDDLTGLDPQSATNLANYVINNGAVAATNAWLEIDNRAIMLNLATPISGQFSVAINNVSDRGFGPNIMTPVTLSSSVVTWPINSDIGTTNATGVFTDPVLPGLSQAIGTDGYYVRAGGHDIWDNADGMHFIYLPVTGNFDVAVRVAALLRPDVWSKAGIMVREDLEGTSRNYYVGATPTNGQNVITAQWRPVKGAGCASIATRPTPSPIPNAWLRMTGTNGTYTTYWGTNGTDWLFLHSTNVTYSATYVGLATTSHNNGTNVANLTAAYYRDLRGLQQGELTPPTLSAKLNGSNLVLSWPADRIGMRLETQSSLGTTWSTVPGSTTTNQIIVPVVGTVTSALYRLASP